MGTYFSFHCILVAVLPLVISPEGKSVGGGSPVSCLFLELVLEGLGCWAHGSTYPTLVEKGDQNGGRQDKWSFKI